MLVLRVHNFTAKKSVHLGGRGVTAGQNGVSGYLRPRYRLDSIELDPDVGLALESGECETLPDA